MGEGRGHRPSSSCDCDLCGCLRFALVGALGTASVHKSQRGSSPSFWLRRIAVRRHHFNPDYKSRTAACSLSSVGWRTGWWRFGPKWLKFQWAVQTFDRPVSLMGASPTPPLDLGPGQNVTLYLSPSWFKAGELRDKFFNRRLPFRRKNSPTKICVVVSMVAAKASVTRVERGLEKFLATGAIADGADKANKAADAKPARA